MPIAAKNEIRKLAFRDGTCPFDDWFESLERDDQYMIDSRFLRVRLGSFGEINNIGDSIWEFKFRKGSALRVYYLQSKQRVVLLIIGGDKGSQRKNIAKAKVLARAYKAGELIDVEY